LYEEKASYGVILISHQCEIFSIKSENLDILCNDELTVSCLRAVYQSKERLYKRMRKKLFGMNEKELREQQVNLMKHLNVS